MKKIFLCLVFASLSVASLWFSYSYLAGIKQLGGIFFAGFLFGILLMTIKLNVKNDKINSYKRELEKESITSDNSLAKVKVLESKIEVLEKALENALKK